MISVENSRQNLEDGAKHKECTNALQLQKHLGNTELWKGAAASKVIKDSEGLRSSGAAFDEG